MRLTADLRALFKLKLWMLLSSSGFTATLVATSIAPPVPTAARSIAAEHVTVSADAAVGASTEAWATVRGGAVVVSYAPVDDFALRAGLSILALELRTNDILASSNQCPTVTYVGRMGARYAPIPYFNFGLDLGVGHMMDVGSFAGVDASFELGIISPFFSPFIAPGGA